MRLAALPFFPLLPASALLATGAVLTGIALGTHPGVTALEVFGTIAASQLAFVAVSLTHYRVRSTRLIPHVQAAIGKSYGPNWRCRAVCRQNWLFWLLDWITPRFFYGRALANKNLDRLQPTPCGGTV